MDANSAYPREYLYALSSRLTETELLSLINVSTPLFVFNYLMIPSVLDAVLTARATATPDNSANTKDKTKEKTTTRLSTPPIKPSPMPTMTRATLLSYKLHVFGNTDIPAVLSCHRDRDPDRDQAVEGMLVLGLTPDQHGLIRKYESDERMMPLRKVHVTVPLHDGEVQMIRAAAYVWNGSSCALTSYGSSAWRIDTFLKSKMYAEIVGEEQGSSSDQKGSEGEENSGEQCSSA